MTRREAAAEVDWDAAARPRPIEAMERAYAPYSEFPVGVAGLVDDGRVVIGCNVENASYGVGLCAECGLVSQLHATGGGRLVAVACVDGDGDAADAVRPLPAAAVGERRARLLVETPQGVPPMTRGAAAGLRPGRPGHHRPARTGGAA